MDNSPINIQEPMEAIEQGEANTYRIMQGNKWVALVRLNGELTHAQQGILLARWLRHMNSTGSSIMKMFKRVEPNGKDRQ